MLRGHVARNLAGLRQLTDSKSPLKQHLDHPQSVRMGERPQTFGGFAKGFQIG
jgi:hypothetical protein